MWRYVYGSSQIVDKISVTSIDHLPNSQLVLDKAAFHVALIALSKEGPTVQPYFQHRLLRQDGVVDSPDCFTCTIYYPIGNRNYLEHSLCVNFSDKLVLVVFVAGALHNSIQLIVYFFVVGHHPPSRFTLHTTSNLEHPPFRCNKHAV